MTTMHWQTDVLGPQWSSLTIPLGSDIPGEPAPVATLVRRASAGQRTAHDPDQPAILYVHGFVDYFFHQHVGDFFANRGYAFYALDLRRHGRSLRPGETPNYVTDLATYREELDLAASIVRDVAGHPRLIALGHSTGGLATALWANARSAPGANHAIDALVLNSPWLALQGPWWDRMSGAIVSETLGRWAPRTPVSKLSEHYGRALHRATGGEWEYDLAFKPHAGFAARAGWLRAILQGQAAVADGLDIRCPVLACTARASGDRKRHHDGLLTSDSVLDAERLTRQAPLLGSDVTIRRFAGPHDLALAPEPVRSQYLTAIASWLDCM